MPDVSMPRLSDTMEEGVLSRWLKQEGDEVHRGDILAEIETDKATMELECYDDGILERLLVKEGTTIPIGETIAVIGDGSSPAAEQASPADQASPAGVAAEPTPEQAPTSPVNAAADAPSAETAAPTDGMATKTLTPDPATIESPSSQAPSTDAGGKPEAVQPPESPSEQIRTSPLARRLAKEHGLDLADITGTGPAGRIRKVDVDAAVAEQEESAAASPADTGTTAAPSTGVATTEAVSAGAVAQPVAGDEELPLSAIRRITAKRLTESASSTPHFYLTSVVDVERLLAFRADLNTQLAPTGPKVSVTDLLARACAVTLRTHPQANSSWGGDKILRHRQVNVGIAVAMDEGLMVPVIKDTDRLGVSEIATQSAGLFERARAGKLSPDEMTGGTFTISNLGMFGIDHFTAVINPPEAAILAVGAATAEPVVVDDEIVVRRRMKLTLSVDHRVLDGASGAAFLRDLKHTLEEPLRIVA